MRKTAIRLMSVFITVLMVLSAVPSAAFASLIDNDPGINGEIADAIRAIAGSEEEAELCYEMLEKYDLLDEDGNLLQNVKPVIDGREYSLGELRELLSGDYDGDKIAFVDGTPITLDNLWNIITIEDYITYLRENVLSEVEWDEAHEQTYADLMENLAMGNVKTFYMSDPSLVGDYSGISHSAVVSFSRGTYAKRSYNLNVTLSGAQPGQKVSFSYEQLSGSAELIDYNHSGTISMTADEDGNASATISAYLSEAPSLEKMIIDTDPFYYVNVYGLENALFENSAWTAATVAVRVDGADFWDSVGDGRAISSITGSFVKQMFYGSNALGLSDAERYAVNNGIINYITTDSSSYDNANIRYSYEVGNDMPKLESADIEFSLSADSGSPFFNDKFSVRLELVSAGMQFKEYDITCEEPPTGRAVIYGEGALGHLAHPITVNDDIYYTLNVQGHVSPDALPEYVGENIIDVYAHTMFLQFADITPPDIESIYASTGEYVYGQRVPVMVRFTEPVKAEGAYIMANGTKVYASEPEGGHSDVLSFLYPVKAMDDTRVHVSEVYAQDPSGNVLSTDLFFDGPVTVSEASLNTPEPLSSVTNITASVNDADPFSPVLNVELYLSDIEGMNDWLGDDLDSYGISKSLAAAVKGQDPVYFALEGDSFAGAVMEASFNIDPVFEKTSVNVELLYNGVPVIGKIATVELEPAAYLTEEDLAASVLVTTAEGGYYEYEDPDAPVIYVQDAPVIKAMFTMDETKFPFLNKANTTVFGADGFPADPDAHFAWSSSDAGIANIDANGIVTPTGKSGEVSFILTALRGGPDGKPVQVSTDPVTFGSGLTPFLIIPNKNMESLSGIDVPVYWSSNIRDKDETALFTVTVFGPDNEVLYEAKDIDVCAAIVPGSILQYSYEEGSVNTFRVKVAASLGGTEYSDETVITLSCAPALITLEHPSVQCFTDEKGSVSFSWTVDSFDRYRADGQSLFRFYVTKNSDPVIDTDLPGTGEGGHFEGSVSVPVSDVVSDPSDPSSYRDVYTVTVQAKNGSDSTWSFDSFVFYVYDEDALRIWVNGKDADGSLTLSNIPEISEMSRDQILALRRDISLEAVVSANYGDFAWTDLYDRLAWSVSDSDKAVLQYRQGTYYESIENYAYTDYRPAAEFVLAAFKDGGITITEQHVLTGISESLEVNIETLRDRLYLFSVAPAEETTARYINGNGEEKTVKSNDAGEFAVYEESGIASDVTFNSEINGAVYYGIIYRSELASGEMDPATADLYPCNNLVLHRIACSYVYIKNPDGTPYKGDIIFRGGIYLNGSYIKNSRFAFDENDLKFRDGAEDTTVTIGDDGKLTVIMDSDQIKTSKGYISPDDEIEYVFYIEKAGSRDLYPLLVKIDAVRNGYEYIRDGEAVATFRKNKSGKETPFIFREELTMRYPEVGYERTVDITGKTSTIGVSPIVPEEVLNITVMLWGENASDEHKMELAVLKEGSINEYEYTFPKQTVRTETYPFIDAKIMTVTQPLNHDTLGGWYASIGADPVKMVIMLDNNTTKVYRKINLTYKVADTTEVELHLDGLAETKEDIEDSLYNSSTVELNGIGAMDSFLSFFVNKLADNNYGPDKAHANGFDLEIRPTQDPTVYIAYLGTGAGSMTDLKVTGAYANGSAEEQILYLPGLREMKLLWGHNWAAFDAFEDSINKEYHDAMGGKAMVQPEYLATGYIECKMIYNHGEWEIHILSGGFDAGGGVSVVKYINTWVSIIPVTVELRGGGTGALSLDVLTMQYINSLDQVVFDNEFLTNFRIFAYFKLFGGLGFDYSVAAFKVGAYGQVNLDANLTWLNRPGLEDPEGEMRYPDGNQIEEMDPVMHGQSISVSGMAGVEFVAKLFIFSYERAFYTIPFEGKTWNFNQKEEIADTWAKSQDFYNTALNDLFGANVLTLAGSTPEGSVAMLNLVPTTQSFDYLEDGGSEWHDNTAKRPLFGAVAGAEVKVLQSNSNPYSDPVLSDDGNVLVYLDTDGETARVRYALRNSSGYVQGDFLGPDGGGDAYNTVSGTKDLAVAAWSAMGEVQAKEAGSPLTLTDQIIMMQGSEVYVSVYRGGSWNTEKLTENSTADLSPVTASNGERAVVIWRNVETSNFEGNIFDFNAKDMLLYRIYDPSSGTWGEVQTLYNGTSGNIMGLNAAMLSDGTAAVIYSLDTDSDNDTISDREIVWTVIGTDGTIIRNVKATEDNNADENPQITTVEINGEERFAAAWHSTDGVNAGDIRLADFGADGVIRGDLPQSVGNAIGDDVLNMTSDFRFSKNSASVGDLSLVWVRRNDSEDISGTQVGYDTLSAVRFYTTGSGDSVIGITGEQEMIDAPDYTLIDSFDVLVRNDQITGVFAGTFYDPEKLVEKVGETPDGTRVSYEVPASTSNIYTLKGTFTDSIEVLDVTVDPTGLRCGAVSVVCFTVMNSGITAIDKITVDIGGQKTTVKDLNVLPGETVKIYADYRAPEDTLVDEDYTVTAETASGKCRTEGTAEFGKVDLEITSAEVIEELEGKRTIEIKLYNSTDARLRGSGRTVEIGFFTDTTCENPVTGLDPIVLSDELSLGMIDEGGYVKQVVFDVEQYLTTLENAPEEIPENGIPVYIRVRALEDGEECPEASKGDNAAFITCDNLEVRRGTEVSIDTVLTVTDDGTTAEVTVMNNRLSEVISGNLIATLFDENGEILEQLETYDPQDPNDGLVTLEGEERKTVTFSFHEKGSRVVVQFTDAVLDDDSDAGLAQFDVINTPAGIGSDITIFEEDPDRPGNFTGTVSRVDEDSAKILFTTNDPEACVTIDGVPADGHAVLPLETGENTFELTVTARDGVTKNTYTFTVVKPELYTVTVIGGTAGTGSAAEGDRVFIEADEAPAGKIFDHWTSGNADILFGDASSEETYFIMPSEDTQITAVFRYMKEYHITSGDGQTFRKGTGEELAFESDGEPGALKAVLVDGEAISDECCVISGEDTASVLLVNGYLETLAKGRHTVRFVFEDGESDEAAFTVEKTGPSTGVGNGPFIPMALIVLSLLVIVFATKRLKKQIG